MYRMSESNFKNKSTDNSEVNYQIQKKWGNAVGKGGLTGYLALPEVLIRGQHLLGLTSTEMMVLINILMHWWDADRMPFPSNGKIAKRMGIDSRTVQRACKKLEDKKLISRNIKTFHGKETNSYRAVRTINLEPLVGRLSAIAADLGEYANNVRLAGAIASEQP